MGVDVAACLTRQAGGGTRGWGRGGDGRPSKAALEDVGRGGGGRPSKAVLEDVVQVEANGRKSIGGRAGCGAACIRRMSTTARDPFFFLGAGEATQPNGRSERWNPKLKMMTSLC
jgi:hypothetical protein